ncbi:MAG TPA: hypothetical protein VFN74_20505 [Chloroflexota bacterium]|jgi:hypothetical protein|nr:hypothetical protein [Chloroflexota bacterium]
MTALNGSVGGPRLIVSVVTRGQADRHVGAAIRAGAQAATVFVGRGTDAEQKVGASGLAVRSEKEVIVTVVGPEIADEVVRAMAEVAADSHPSDYIAKMPVTRVVGLLEAVAMAAESNGTSARANGSN